MRRFHLLAVVGALFPILLSAQRVRVRPVLDTIPGIQWRAERGHLQERFPAEWRALSDALTKDRLTLERFRGQQLSGTKALEASRVIDHVHDIDRAYAALAKTERDAPLPPEVTRVLGATYETPPLRPAPATSSEEPPAEWTSGGRGRSGHPKVSYPPHDKTHPEPAPPVDPAVSPTVSREPPPEKPPSPIPSSLYEGIQAYCGGKYGRAIEILGAAAPEEGYYRAQVALFRAASRFSQYTVDGSRDERLRQALLADIREFRRFDPKHDPDSRFFSPRFRAFVASTAR